MYAEAARCQAVKAEGSFHFSALLLLLLCSTATVFYIHSTTRIENPPRHRYYRQFTILRHFTKNCVHFMAILCSAEDSPSLWLSEYKRQWR